MPGSGQKQYTGHPINFDFEDADLRAVLRVFSGESGLNMIIDPQVQGRVNVLLNDVPWDQALDQILRSNKLGYTVEGNIIRIAPLAVLAREQEEEAKLTEAQGARRRAARADLHPELREGGGAVAAADASRCCRRAARSRSTRAPTR